MLSSITHHSLSILTSARPCCLLLLILSENIHGGPVATKQGTRHVGKTIPRIRYRGIRWVTKMWNLEAGLYVVRTSQPVGMLCVLLNSMFFGSAAVGGLNLSREQK